MSEVIEEFGEVIEVTDKSEFQDLLETEDILVVKFWAEWCGPCKAFAPHFKQAAESAAIQSNKLGRATFVAVDVDAADWAMVDYGVMGIPAVKLFQNGQFVADLKPTRAVPLLADIASH